MTITVTKGSVSPSSTKLHKTASNFPPFNSLGGIDAVIVCQCLLFGGQEGGKVAWPGGWEGGHWPASGSPGHWPGVAAIQATWPHCSAADNNWPEGVSLSGTVA